MKKGAEQGFCPLQKNIFWAAKTLFCPHFFFLTFGARDWMENDRLVLLLILQSRKSTFCYQLFELSLYKSSTECTLSLNWVCCKGSSVNSPTECQSLGMIARWIHLHLLMWFSYGEQHQVQIQFRWLGRRSLRNQVHQVRVQAS
jgi:hypothetical protein